MPISSSNMETPYDGSQQIPSTSHHQHQPPAADYNYGQQQQQAMMIMNQNLHQLQHHDHHNGTIIATDYNHYYWNLNTNHTTNRYIDYHHRQQNGGYRQKELLYIMSSLGKFQLTVCLAYVVQGLSGNLKLTTDYYLLLHNQQQQQRDSFAGLCQTNMIAGCAGALCSAVGLWALSRYRWKCTMVAYLILSILSAVAFLLVVIHAGVWLGEAHKTNVAQTAVIMGVIVLLVGVATGVCFILSSSFICHLWARRNRQSRQSRLKHQMPGMLVLTAMPGAYHQFQPNVPACASDGSAAQTIHQIIPNSIMNI